MTLKDASAFQLLVIYLCNTHVKLEIHLSLPDNNVQNGASCMNHYLQLRVVLLMNIHEARDGKEICSTCHLQKEQKAADSCGYAPGWATLPARTWSVWASPVP